MGRYMPTECQHGTTVDWGDFGPCQNCDLHDDDCPNLADCELCENMKTSLQSYQKECKIADTPTVNNLR